MTTRSPWRALAVAALALSAALAACSDQPDAQAIRPAKAVVEHPIALEFTVNGMHCGGCVASIETTVNPLEGVQGCEVSLEQGTMRCMVDDPARQESILQAVQKLRYEISPRPRSAPAPAPGPQSLHFTITGMSDEGCIAGIEGVVLPLEGVQGCEVSLETGAMTCRVDDPQRQAAIIEAVRTLNYGIEPRTPR